MPKNNQFDIFEGVPNCDDTGAFPTMTAAPTRGEAVYDRETLLEMSRDRLVEHCMRMQDGYARLVDDINFLSWEFRDYQENLTYFSRVAKLAHKLNASDLNTIAQLATTEIPQYFHCQFGTLYLYNIGESKFELLRSSYPNLERENEADRDTFLSRLFASCVYPFLVEYGEGESLVEMESGDVVAECPSSLWRQVLGERALIFPLRVKQQDSLDPLMLGGLIIAGGKDVLAIKDADLSVLFCDLLSSSVHNAQLMEKLGNLTIIDPLTQVFNRRHLINQLNSLTIQACRQRLKLSLVMMDIDHFKQFNDKHGHVCGDEVLRNVASILKTGIRTGVDVPARFGGEEFVLVAPFTDLNAAMDVADRLRKRIKADKVVFAGKELSVTCSFGVAEYIEGEPLETFVERADAALYHAKKTGRDKVCSTDDCRGDA